VGAEDRSAHAPQAGSRPGRKAWRIDSMRTLGYEGSRRKRKDPVYTERYSIPFLASVLISAAERRRPGLGPWSEKTKDEIRAVFQTELSQMRQQFFELFDDAAYWEKVERTLLDVCLPRYCALAEKQTNLERRDFGLWRGGDLVARGTYAAAGLLIGILMVRLPFIPIPQTWDLFAFLTMLAGPFIPDAQIWFYKRKHRRELEAIVADMRQAEEQLRLYQPLQEPRLRTAESSGGAVSENPGAIAQRGPTRTRG